jgi:hypothetical protein
MRGKISLTLKDCAPIDNNIVDLIPPESIAAYLYIKQRLENRESIYNDPEFRFVFRSFYGISNRTMDSPTVDAYFEIFERYRNSCFLCIKNLLSELYSKSQGENKKYYSSFITKLMHSIDNELPIYDSNVNKVFSSMHRQNADKNKRLESISYYYDKLIYWYKEVMPKNEEIKKTITYFRSKFKCPKINDVKVADFILWQAGKQMKQQDASLQSHNKS